MPLPKPSENCCPSVDAWPVRFAVFITGEAVPDRGLTAAPPETDAGLPPEDEAAPMSSTTCIPSLDAACERSIFPRPRLLSTGITNSLPASPIHEMVGLVM